MRRISDLNILVVDDDAIYRKEIVKSIKLFSTKCDETENRKKAIETLERKHYGIILLDGKMSMKDITGTLATIKAKFPSTKIILMVGRGMEKQYADSLITLDISGYVLKGSTDEINIESILSIALNGGQYFTPGIIKIGYIASRSYKPVLKIPMDANLTKKEAEIAELIYREYTSRQIADKLCISINTVNTHRQNLYKKLQVKNSTGVAGIMARNGWI